MKASLVLGRLFGIEIGIHISWLFIFVFLTWSLAVGYFPQDGVLAGQTALVYWILGAISSLSLFLAVLAHELGHSIVAQRNGIPVKNITLFIFGGASNISREAASPGAEFRMAVAGPLVSFGLSAVFFTAFFSLGQATNALSAVLIYLAQVNLILGVFNMLPGFPLDGGRVFRAAVWKLTRDETKATRIAAGAGQAIAYMFIFGGIALAFIVGISGLWLALIGWFLASAASASYQKSVVSESLSGTSVGTVMNAAIITAGPDLSVEQAMALMLRHSQRALPVIGDGYFLGMLTLSDLKHLDRKRWDSEKISSIITPAASLRTLKRGDDLTLVMEIMHETGYNQLPVLDNGAFLGLVSRADLLNYLNIKLELKP
ncbi:MAG: site-2 protease family protein [Dehalogenimonas sp.]|uniref:Zinc metalloprotease n=1 Tax=Candidatus Dehalogenimonas loeffleri TaxID=3127115 RepID=A0ABZ2JAM0_9CHLR|nr:site-2 protease family protein [Dehalogenimonas sp.]